MLTVVMACSKESYICCVAIVTDWLCYYSY